MYILLVLIILKTPTFFKNNRGVYGGKDLSLNYLKQWHALRTDLETASNEKQEVDKKLASLKSSHQIAEERMELLEKTHSWLIHAKTEFHKENSEFYFGNILRDEEENETKFKTKTRFRKKN